MIGFINWFTEKIIIRNINNTKSLNSAIFKLIHRLLNHQLLQ